MKKELRDYLLSFASLTALIGAQGVYQQQAPAGVSFPYIVVNRITEPREHILAGASGHVVNSNFQIDVWAKSGTIASQVKEIVRDKLDGFLGDMGGVYIQGALLQDSNDDSDVPIAGTATPAMRISMDFFISFNESIPTLT